MKRILFFASALLALASCTSDEFTGDKELVTNNDAITIGSFASSITRATSNTGTDAKKLDGQFKIYGVKKTTAWNKVFEDYVVFSNTSTTTSNPDADWEYVGTTSTTYGEDNTALTKEQTIKYWDHAATYYHFVAGSPVSSFTYTLESTGENAGDIKSATVSGLAGHVYPNSSTAINTDPVYIADPVNVPEANYRNEVVFNFVRQQARVRVGIFETIPGYKITNIQFYPYSTSAWDTTPSDTIILASTTANYFVGGANDVVEGTITYDWTTSPASYTFTYDAASGKSLTQTKNWYAGALNATGWEMAKTSSESTIAKFYGADGDMDATTGYFTVIPTPTATTASPLLIKCDYTLTSESDGSGETITIHGATAAIPAAFCKWEPNTSYTYLFKISDNTNGKTNPSQDEEGLFPITFDAVVVAEATGTEQGTITTVSTPNITTYQAGSVTDEGIEYSVDKPIYLTVQDNTSGELNTLTDGGATVGAVQVYQLAGEATEADLQLIAPTGTDLFTLGSTETTVQVTVGSETYNTVTLPADKHGSFTPTATGYYAIQYLTTAASGSDPAAYTYKVVYVKN